MTTQRAVTFCDFFLLGAQYLRDEEEEHKVVHDKRHRIRDQESSPFAV